MTAENDGGGAAGVPLLVLDTGGHTARITAIGFTPDGRQLVSTSYDKTIRVWDIDIGKSARIIRGEISAGISGRINALALSPDANWLAVGGRFSSSRAASNAIRLYDFASGRLVALLKAHASNVLESV
jgi:WD40 repeat protein